MSYIKELESTPDFIEFGFFLERENTPIFQSIYFLPRSPDDLADRPTRETAVSRSLNDASFKVVGKQWKSSLDRRRDREPRECSPRKKFEIAVKAFCVDCCAQGEPICPPEDLYDQDFVMMLSRAVKTRRRAISDWEMALISGWKDKGYYKMDRYELAAAVNPSLKRKLKPDTLWKYATQRLGLFSERLPGPKPRV